MPDPLTAAPAVSVSGLVMRYGEVTAVDGLDLTVERGTITAVLGPNGAGKTTTLETCEGYRRPMGGQVRVLGMDPIADRKRLLPRIGVMLQAGGAWAAVRPEEMLRHIAALHTDPLPVGMLMERLGLTAAAKTPFRRLSGGMQQRLGLALAIVGRPELVFVDEPTAGMDPQARRDTWELLEELRSDGVTTVLTTHYLEEAERLADMVHVIDHGRLIASGSPASLTRGSSKRTIRLVLTTPYPTSAPDDLARQLGVDASVTPIDDQSLLISGPADAGTLAVVSQWCVDHEVVPDSLVMGQRTLEDVFLQLTGREME